MNHSCSHLVQSDFETLKAALKVVQLRLLATKAWNPRKATRCGRSGQGSRLHNKNNVGAPRYVEASVKSFYGHRGR